MVKKSPLNMGNVGCKIEKNLAPEKEMDERQGRALRLGKGLPEWGRHGSQK